MRTLQNEADQLLPKAPLTREQITAAVEETLREYIENGEVKCAYDVGNGACEDFALSIIDKLTPDGRETDDLDTVEYANFTGPGSLLSDREVSTVFADGVFYPETLRAFGVKLPTGITVDQLNASGLGDIGTHVFVRWKSPQGFLYFDAEAPQGVDSPFSLPFAQEYLKQSKR